jgi:hypothetical protein
MLNHATGNGAHPLAARGPDLYETPPAAVRALLKVERLPRVVWEPACGPGAIVGVLREAGHLVRAGDLHDWGCPDSYSEIDFLKTRTAPPRVRCIVTNPPFKLAGEFVAHGLGLVPTVIMLLRLAFLESARRSDVLDGGQLARVHVFANRLPMMHRNGWAGKRASSAMAFAWFRFERDHHGPALLDRISWRPS